MLIYWTNTNGGDFSTTADWETDQVPPGNRVPGGNDIAAMVEQAPAQYVVDDDDNTVTTVAGFTTGPDTLFEITNDSFFIATDGTATGANVGQVTVADGSFLEVGDTLDNIGTIALNSTTHDTYLLFFPATTLTGGGQIDLSNSSDNIIEIGTSTEPTPAFVTNVNNTIEGSGEIKFTSDSTQFWNEQNGVIDADENTGTLTILDSSIYNEGTLTATNAGTLLFTGGSLYNGSAAEIGTDNGTVEFQGTTVYGGTFFASTNFALVEFASNNNELEGSQFSPVTIEGTLTIANDSSVAMAGVIDNDKEDGGTIDLDDTGSGVDVFVGIGTNTELTLTGAGNVDLDEEPEFIAESGTTTPPELINVNNDISGGGVIDVNVDNEKLGIIDATGSTYSLAINGNVENAGELEGTGSQGLFLDGVTNTATGVITAGTGSSVTLQSKVTGGTLITVGTGVIVPDNNSTLKSLSTLGSVAPEASYVTFSLVGTIDNTGSITLREFEDEIGQEGNLTLEGRGTVQMTGQDDAITGFGILDNDGNTISGAGLIGDGTTSLFTNLTVHNLAGTIEANGISALSIDTGSNTIVNDATLAAVDESELYLGSPVSNNGVLDANGGYITAAAAVTGGTATINALGEIEFGAASDTTVKFVPGSEGVLVLDDAVQYSGTIVGFNAAEAIDLTDIPATAKMSYSAGVLTINGGLGDVAHLHFSGSFTLSEFALTGDGGNGSILTDPPAATGASNVALLGSYMAAAFAKADGQVTAAAPQESIQSQAILVHPHTG